MTQPSPGSPASSIFQGLGSPSGGFPQSTDPSAGNAYLNERANNGHKAVPGASDGPNLGTATATAAEHYPTGGQLDKGTFLQQAMLGSINSPDETIALQQQLIQSGFLSPKAKTFSPGQINPNDATYYALSNALDKAINTGTSYQDILAQTSAKGSQAMEYYTRKFGIDGSGGVDPYAPKAYQQASAQIPTNLDARGAVFAAAKQVWGRDPNADEVQQFTQVLQTYAQQHPQVTQGVYDPSLGYRGDRQSTTTGGLSGAAISQAADEFVHGQGANEQAAASHGINTYMQVFEQALKGGASGG